MRYVFVFLLFLCNELIGQSPMDSTVIDLPKYVPCTSVVIYLDGVPIDTQALTPNFTQIDYSVLGMGGSDSPDYPDYTRIVRNYITLGTPFQSIDIRTPGCLLAMPGVRVYKKHFNVRTTD